jgi:Domain of Unknown Function (DUF1206).
MGSGGGKSDTTEDLTAQILAQPFGQWLVGLAGSIVIGVGFSYFYEAYKAKFRRHFKLDEMSQTSKLGRHGWVDLELLPVGLFSL